VPSTIWKSSKPHKGVKVKSAYLVIAIFLFCTLALPQDKYDVKPPNTSEAALTATAPACPPGRACQSFQELWRANDRVVRNAKWVCFVTSDDFVKDRCILRQDRFVLLTPSPSEFFFDAFDDGIQADIDVAVRRVKYATTRSNTTYWNPNETSATAMTVTLDSDELNVRREYLSAANIYMIDEFTMRLSNGRFSDNLFAPEWVIRRKGECTELNKERRQ
jgi:hypothetical protein